MSHLSLYIRSWIHLFSLHLAMDMHLACEKHVIYLSLFYVTMQLPQVSSLSSWFCLVTGLNGIVMGKAAKE
jgi:hypothetical protein